MADVKMKYAQSTTIDCTLAALANSSTLGRSGVAVDNSGNLYDDALLYIAVKASGTTLGGDKTVYVYLYGSEDGINFDGSTLESPGTDVGVNIPSPTNLKGPIPIAAPGTSATYKTTIPVGQFFGGRLPRQWGFVIRNATGQALNPIESNHTKTYTGITYTVV